MLVALFIQIGGDLMASVKTVSYSLPADVVHKVEDCAQVMGISKSSCASVVLNLGLIHLESMIGGAKNGNATENG